MATNTYQGKTTGTQFWDASGNWSTGAVPTNSDAVVFSGSGTYTVSITSTDNPYVISTLTIGLASGNNVTLSIGGSLADQGFASLSNGTISVLMGGRFTTLGSVSLGNAATLNIMGTFIAPQITGGSGDTVNISNGGVANIGTTSDSATYTLSSSGVLNLAGTVSAADTFQFADSTTDLLTIGSSSTQLDAKILGLNGANAIDLTSLGFSFNYQLASNGSGGTLIRNSFDNSTVYTFTNLAYTTGLHLSNDGHTGGTLIQPCFVTGSAIATPTGTVAVEHLLPGDLVRTASGAAVPVKWVGRRKVDLARHPRPELANPVRIHAGAVEAGVPCRDLLISPDHAIFLNGVLIPAELLVNGATVTRVTDFASVEYFHVELERHDILLVEGLAAESYLDTGNRATFSNAGLAVLLNPEFCVAAGARAWATDACAPLALTGPAVAVVKQQLLDRATGLGLFDVVADPDVRLVAGARTIRPMSRAANTLRFAIPRGTDAVRLVSRSASPSDVTSAPGDRRVLGVAVGRIKLSGTSSRAVPVDGPALTEGWHAIEPGANWRWTDGDGTISLGDGVTMVELEIAGTLPYRVEPAEKLRAAA